MHILLVEDDENERQSFAMILERAGFDVSSAQNGREAIDRFSSPPLPDVVVLDLYLPDMLSLEIIPKIKSLQPAPKIILMTAEIREEYQQKAQEIGVNAYLLKPVSPDNLIDILNQFSHSS